MNRKDFYLFFSAILSFALYFTVIGFILFYIGNFEKRSKQYTAKKNSFIEISINEKKKSDIVKKPVKKKSIKKVKKRKPKKRKKVVSKKSSKRTVKNSSLKSLFSSINTKKYIKDRNISKKDNLNSRIPKKAKVVEIEKSSDEKLIASKLTKSLSLEDVSSKISRRNGEYNQYIGKISDLIDEKWQETPGSMPGNDADVIVKIDKFGNFSYKIEKLSYNSDFNAKLETFLESLKDEKFPPYKSGNFIEIKVNFKDEL